MKAALLVAPRSVRVQDVPTPQPAAGEVLVQVSLAGICGSDHTLYAGKFNVPLPVIPGHEMVGRVAALGPGVAGLAVGQRVTLQPNIGCEACPLCLSGSRNLCPSKIRKGVDANGVFAEYACAPARYLWPVPESLTDEVAVFTEPLAVVVHAMAKAAPENGERVLILGAGVIGLLALQFAAASGAEVSALDLNDRRLEQARKLGAAHTYRADGSLESLHNRFDCIYETSGSPGAMALAVSLAAPQAFIVLLGLPGEEHPVATTLIVRKELRLLGSLIYTNEFPMALELLQGGGIATAPLVSGRIDLDGLDAALGAFSSSDRVKTLVTIG